MKLQHVLLHNNIMVMEFFVLLGGLLIGSFIGALTYRLPSGQNFVKGRSYCDSCKKDLTWLDNIPLFSYLFYLGKSRCCNKKISIRYPLIELSSALGAVLLFYLFPFPLFTIYYLLFTITLAIFVIDLEHQIIPDELSWTILFLGIILSQNAFFSMIFYALLMASLILLIHLITKGQGMGLGDVKLVLALGIWLNIWSGLNWLILSFIIGGMFALVLLILKKVNLKTKIAFGPFLILAFWIVLIYKL